MSVLKAILQASKKEKGKCHIVYFEEVTNALHFTSYSVNAFIFHYGYSIYGLSLIIWSIIVNLFC